MRFLQLVVFLCELLTMYFLVRCCVFFGLSLLFLVTYVLFNVMNVAVVLESRVLLFSMILF